MRKTNKVFLIIGFIALMSLTMNISTAKAVTAEGIQVQIQALLAQIAQLQEELTKLQGGEVAWCHNFHLNLKFGMGGTEVRALQTALTKEGSKVWEYKGFDGIFDEMTASEVVGFQEKYASEILTSWGLAHGTGYVGSTTRAKLNKLYGCGVAVKPYIKVLSPNGGEIWTKGNKYIIKWTSKTESSRVVIDLLNTSGKAVGIELPAVIVNNGSIEWTIPTATTSGQYRLRIMICPTSFTDLRCANVNLKEYGYDESNNYFSIVSSTTACNSTDMGDFKYDVYEEGTTTYKGESKTDYCMSSVKLKEYFCDYTMGTSWLGDFEYDCPNGCQDGACIKEESITVTSPNGGEEWEKGETYVIDWEAIGVDDIEVISLVDYRDLSNPVAYDLAYHHSTELLYSWTISDSIEAGDKYKIKINASLGEITVFDKSDNYFSIVSSTTQPTIGISSPNYGDVWQMDSTYNIMWFANNFTGYDKVNIILLDARAGDSYYVIATDVSAMVPSGTYAGTPMGIYSWVVPTTGIIPGETNTFKIYIGKYNPPAQSGDWEPLKVYAETGLYGYGNNFNIVSTSAAPIINDIRPSSIVQGQTLQVTLYGYNLSGATTTSGSCGLNPTALGGFILGNCNIQSLFVSVGITASNNAAPGQRQFTITTSSGTSNAVTFTVLSSSVDRSIKVISPNGGETWEIGKTYRITWESQGIDFVKININNNSISGSGSTNYIIPNGNAIENIGYYYWTVSDKTIGPMLTGDQNRYRIFVYDSNYESTKIKDQSDNYFSIVEASAEESIKVISPNGGETWAKGNTYDIIWKSSGVEKVDIILDRRLETAQQKDATIVYNIVNSGQYLWTIPEDIVADQNQYKIEVRKACPTQTMACDYSYAQGVDLDRSDNYFSIVEAKTVCSLGYVLKDGACIKEESITVISPNGGEEWIFGKSGYYIKWQCVGLEVDKNVWIELVGPNIQKSIAQVSCGSPPYEWVIPSDITPGDQYRIKVKTFAPYPITISDESDNYFSIVEEARSITVTSPNGGETWVKGNTYDITWKFSGVENVHIDVSRFGTPSHAYTLISDISASTGKYSWTIGAKWSDLLVADTYKIRVFPYPFTEDDTWQVYDQSDNYFSIVSATLACTDSDFGRNYYMKGYTKRGDAAPYADSCYCPIGGNDENLGACSEGAYLGEWYCDATGYPKMESRVKCPNGCQDGACKGAVGLESIDKQLAAVSNRISNLLKELKKLMGR